MRKKKIYGVVFLLAVLGFFLMPSLFDTGTSAASQIPELSDGLSDEDLSHEIVDVTRSVTEP